MNSDFFDGHCLTSLNACQPYAALILGPVEGGFDCLAHQRDQLLIWRAPCTEGVSCEVQDEELLTLHLRSLTLGPVTPMSQGGRRCFGVLVGR